MEPVAITEALVIGGVTRSRRTPVRVDPIEAALLRGTFTTPEEGKTITFADGTAPDATSTSTWTKVVAGDDGFLRHEGLRGGYAFVTLESDAPRAMLLEAAGHGMVYVNGEPRVGDPYQYGNTLLPIELESGTNTLLFSVSRGVLRARLTPIAEPPRPTLERRDMTLPDLLVGAPVDSVAGVMVVNPTPTPLRGAVIRASVAGAPPIESAVPELPAFGIVKAPVRLTGAAPQAPGAVPVTLELFDRSSPAPAPAPAVSQATAPPPAPSVAPTPPPSDSPAPATPPAPEPTAAPNAESGEKAAKSGESAPRSDAAGGEPAPTSQEDVAPVTPAAPDATAPAGTAPEATTPPVAPSPPTESTTPATPAAEASAAPATPPAPATPSAPPAASTPVAPPAADSPAAPATPAAPAADAPISQLAFELQAVDANTTRRETFLSSIDGSAQYFAVQPAAPGAGETPGLLLSLHGASVEASGQAAAYQRKPWAHVVAPTNRRPFGFDWEDWGRLDAIEVLDLARARLESDPRRQWLTGHSMGGHGAWQLAVHFPDRFAAVAPSAGWVAFPAGGPDTDPAHPIGAILGRAALPSRTMELRENLARQGVSILHGDADDNVSVANARSMRAALAQFHGDFVYREQPGAGHWWGNECLDWPPFANFFTSRTLVPAAARSPLVFVTASPSVSARCDWALVDAQKSPFELSRIELSRDAGARRVTGATVNVARLAIDLPGAGFAPDAPVRVELDGTTLDAVPWPAEGRLWLEWSADGGGAGATAPTEPSAGANSNGGDGSTTNAGATLTAGAWRVAAPPGPLVKNHVRGGPFKDAFRNRMVFVFGTQGTPEENAVQRSKARFDAEGFWYRGNGAVPVIADSEFDPAKFADRNVILYGNAETNAAWSRLLGESPVQVTRAGVRVGARTIPGDDLCCLFVRPRPDSTTASVAAVSGTGLAGLRLSERMPYFVSGVGYPDVTVIGADMLERGVDGIRAAGWFGNDWSLERGTIAFAAEATAPPAAPSAAPAAAPAPVASPTAAAPSPPASSPTPMGSTAPRPAE